MPTEADTCRKLVVPKLQAADWDNEPHSIAQQRQIVAELDTLNRLQARAGNILDKQCHQP